VKQREWLFIAIALLGASAYLGFAAVRGIFGFPLDDGWIHQVYARNLATRGEFAFFAGQPSAGSTAPLWTILLAVGYVLHLDFRIWTYFIGALLLGVSAILAARLAEQILTQYATRNTFHVSRFTSHGSLVALFLLPEWHLAWSAVSGMEIPLFVFLSLLLLERFVARAHSLLLGCLAALLTLTRPEGIVLAALIGIAIALDATRNTQHAIRNTPDASHLTSQVSRFTPSTSLRAWFYAIGYAIPIAPYLAFNLTTSSTLFPNTFYAKSAEYAILFERVPFVVRYLQLLAVPWVGAQILLLPGFVFGIVMLVRQRAWIMLIPFAWVLLLPALYALRLPVAYQHGRYEMPIVPFIALYGIVGTAALLAHIRSWVVRTTWTLSVAATLVAFWLIGANAYTTDVAIIDCEMVQTARWIAANAPADALVAAHDIGALGYFYAKPFIDLAGLVTPDVIPFIRDEGHLRDYLFARHVTFAIFFPDWYPALASDPRLVPVHQRDCAVTRAAGAMSMVVYEVVLTGGR
jgi:hypothetical protein